MEKAKGKINRILVLTYWDCRDPLITTYTLPYLKIILKHTHVQEVHLVTLNKGTHRDLPETIPGLVHHPFPYTPFGAKALLQSAGRLFELRALINKFRIDAIHAWCTPAGALGYLLSIMTGKPLIIDSFEPHAESMTENGTWKTNSAAFRILWKLEALQAKRAQRLICTSDRMPAYMETKWGITGKTTYVKYAGVDLSVFDPGRFNREKLRESLGLSGKIIGIYPGKFGGIYLEDEFFSWLKTAQEHWGEKFFMILLTGHSEEYLKEKFQAFGIDGGRVKKLFVPHTDVPQYLAMADFGVCPVKPVPSKRLCTPIKNGEFWAMGLPVIMPDGIGDDCAIITKNGFGFLQRTFSNEENKASLTFMDNWLEDKDLAAKKELIRNSAKEFRAFENAVNIYRNIYGG